MDVIKCSLCERPAEHRHHLFSRTAWATNLYGKLIDDDRNIMLLCSTCHLNKPIPKMTEKEFCNKLGIEIISKESKLEKCRQDTAQAKKLKN